MVAAVMAPVTNDAPPKRKRVAGSELKAWLSRTDIEDMLHVTYATIKAWEGRGFLHPRKMDRIDSMGRIRNIWVYDPQEVAKLPRKHHPYVQPPEGEIAARAYELFGQGMSFREVVVAVRQTPEQVRALHEKWLDDGGADLVITPAAKDMLVAKVGDFGSVAELVERVGSIGKRKRD
jgi:hypothetical protein